MIRKKMDELGRSAPVDALQSELHPIIIILDDVRSMHNVGSAFRTCDAFSAAALFLCGYTPAPPHRDIHKTALGATESVKWRHFQSVSDAINEARTNGYKIFAVEQVHGSFALNSFRWNKEPIALIFGNEVDGVSDAALSLCDGAIEIPQWGSKHSLNISVSIGVVMWELARET